MGGYPNGLIKGFQITECKIAPCKALHNRTGLDCIVAHPELRYVVNKLQPPSGRNQKGADKLKIRETNDLYSERSDLTGLERAARMACELTVNNAISMAARPAYRNIHHSSEIR